MVRQIPEEVRERLEAQCEEPESQEIYKLRMQKAELPFGHIFYSTTQIKPNVINQATQGKCASLFKVYT